MFGILMLLFSGVMGLVADLHDGYESSRERSRARERQKYDPGATGLYTDANGISRFIDTNERGCISKDRWGNPVVCKVDFFGNETPVSYPTVNEKIAGQKQYEEWVKFENEYIRKQGMLERYKMVKKYHNEPNCIYKNKYYIKGR